jgi:UDP-GlcNAc:undecaprenyl-phosphate GlcNAc-1-phosphate transferase
MILFYAFLCPFLLAILLVPWTIKISNHFNIFKPKRKDVKGKPCIGGIGIYIAFLVTVLFALLFKYIDELKILGLLASSTLIILLGLIDDINDINPFLKIIGELSSIIILLLFGIVTKIVFLPGWLNAIITILWILFITNAFNLLDIMDGLTSGLVIIISLTLLVISIINRDIFSSTILTALIGAHSGFLKYNYPPAKVYMGDTGSLFSGFILAAVAINISYAPLERKVALITPILAMSLPIYDTLFLITMRLKKKRPIFNKTNDHFALRLLTMGYSVRDSMWIMYAFSIFLAISSIIVAFSSNIISSVILAAVILVFILIGKKVGTIKIDD